MRAWQDGRELNLGPAQQRAVLTALLLRRGVPVRTERLIDDVWGEEPPRTAVMALRTYIWRLRRSVGCSGGSDGDGDGGAGTDSGDSLIVSTRLGYAMPAAIAQLDLADFDELAARARTLRERDPAAAHSLYGEALELWVGPALSGVPGPHAEIQRIQLSELWLTVFEEYMDCALQLGLYTQAVAALSGAVTEHPLHERLRELQMLALHGAGRQADALAVYRNIRNVLGEQLGIEPGPGLRDVHQHVLSADPAVRARLARPAAPTGEHQNQGARTPGSHIRPAQLPPAVEHFVGRKDEVDTLFQRASSGTAPTAALISLIHGMAGVGKTALAVRTATTLASHFPDGQLYVDLRGFDPSGRPADPAEVLADFLAALGVPRSGLPDSLPARTAMFRSALAQRRVLIVLDNARDADQVRPLLPGTPGCFGIITSRNAMPGLVASHGIHTVPLPVLGRAESAEFLAARLGTDRVEQEVDAVAVIADRCAGLPLALAVVAARSAQLPQESLAGISRALVNGMGLDGFVLKDADPAANARAVFSWSYRALSRPAARLFRLLSVHPGPDISAFAAAATGGLTLREARETLAELASANLLTARCVDRYVYHDLLRDYGLELAGRADREQETHAAFVRLCDHHVQSGFRAAMLLTPDRAPISPSPATPDAHIEEVTDTGSARRWFDANAEVVLALIPLSAERAMDACTWQLAWVVDAYLALRDLWQQKVISEQHALAAVSRLGDKAKQAAIHRAIAGTKARLDDFEAATVHLEDALRLLDGSEDQAAVAAVHRSIDYVLMLKGDYAAALDHARIALRLGLAAGSTADIAHDLNSIGWCHARMGRYIEALVTSRMVVRRDLVAADGNELAKAMALDTMGLALYGLGQLGHAENVYCEAVAILRRIGSPSGLADSLDSLGDVEVAMGRPDIARALWAEAAELLERLGRRDAEKLRAKMANSG